MNEKKITSQLNRVVGKHKYIMLPSILAVKVRGQGQISPLLFHFQKQDIYQYLRDSFSMAN